MNQDMLRLPPLPALRFFYAVGNTTSIRRAAVDLNVTHTAVIRQIRALEAWFGATLVEATASGTVLNAQGQRLHASVSQAFELISQAAGEIRPPGQTQELRICVAPGFATYWILPRLHLIQRELPGVAIRIIPHEAPCFDRHETDIEIAYGRRADTALVNIELLRPRFVALASDTWIAKHPQVTTARDLLEVSLVQENQPEVWHSWFHALGIPSRKLHGPRLGAVTTVLEAVHLDQGPGLFAELLVDERLTRGRLRAVVPDAPQLDAYVLVALKSRIEEPAIRRFVAWIQRELGAAGATGT